MNAQVDLREPEQHQVSCYLSGLRDSIHEKLALHSIWQLPKAVNLAYKVKSHESKSTHKFSPSRCSFSDNKSYTGQSSSAHREASSSTPTPSLTKPGTSQQLSDRAPSTIPKVNPYTRPATI